jgi:hypothetical protein
MIMGHGGMISTGENRNLGDLLQCHVIRQESPFNLPRIVPRSEWVDKPAFIE